MNLGNRIRALVGVIALAGGSLVGVAVPAGADYGSGAVYQIEISANLNNTGNSLAGLTKGGGIWLWITLNANNTGDYSGSDCGHGLGAFADSGNITSWSSDGTNLTISGIVLNGLQSTVTVTVPSTRGHYSYQSISAVFTGLPSYIPPFGMSQVQVAP